MYKIVVTEIETGEVLVDDTSNCIIGAINDPVTQGVGCLSVVNCSGHDLVAVLAATKNIIKKAIERRPELEIMLEFYEKFMATETEVEFDSGIIVTDGCNAAECCDNDGGCNRECSCKKPS